MTTIRSNLCMVVSNDGKDYALNFGGSLVTIFSGEDNLTISYAHLDALISALEEGRSFMEVDYNAQEGEKKPKQIVESIFPEEKFTVAVPPEPNDVHPDFVDDPNLVHLLRHEYKDLYFSTADLHAERRDFTGNLSDAHPFATRYAALRFSQGLKHPTVIIPVPAANIVSWRVTENDVRHYYNGTAIGTLHASQAHKLSLIQADNVALTLPPHFIISYEKVAA